MIFYIIFYTMLAIFDILTLEDSEYFFLTTPHFEGLKKYNNILNDTQS